jgi:hypothetical protein
MPDSTKDLLNAHHAAVLRELNQVHSNISHSLSELKDDMGGIRERMDAHNRDDEKRFGVIENDMGVLKWAYGVGLVIVAAVYALLKMGS